MMNSAISVFLHRIFWAFIFGTTALCAQTLVDEVPPEFEEPVEVWVDPQEKQTSPFYKQRLTDDGYAQRIQTGQIFGVANDMVSQFDSSDWGVNETEQQKILNQLQRFLGALKVALLTQGIDGAPDRKAEQNIFLEALNEQEFGLNSLQMELVFDTSGNEVRGYFAETDDELVLYEFIEVENEEKVQLRLTKGQVREWRLLEDALTNLVTEQVALVSDANIHALKNAVVRWENFLDKGYSQMPWESYINGKLIDPPGFPELGPPDHQWLFLHPTLGLELRVDPLDETRVKEVMHIELLGHIWYRGSQLDDFSGFSVATSLREDLDSGIGLMFHIKRNWSIGITWHDVDEDPFLFLSVDLFRFAKQNAEKYEQQYRKLRAQLGTN